MGPATDRPPGSARARPRLFGTCEGVLVPTTLTILGVILFLRTGWVVGRSGLAGAWLVIGLAYLVSATTALSLSSLVTNMRVGAGGVFSVLLRTLGVELAGSIGLPLYLSQALAIPLYVFGFREGWSWLFPGHAAWLVDLCALTAVFAIAFVSTRLAFRVQYVILAVVGLAIASLLAAVPAAETLRRPTWWGQDPDPTITFAVFFPAVTGIMAGANMSGELARPDRSIPRGTLIAIGVTALVYMGVAGVLGVLAPQQRLVSDERAMIDLALWSPLVLAGLLAATLSSALSTMVGAPRILHALAAKRVIPWKLLRQRGGSGEPRAALVVTGLVALCAIALRDLNAIAELLTLFFLLTYATVNAVLLAQQLFGTIQFRPRIRLPIAVPLVGFLSCIGAMIAIDPAFTAVTIALCGTLYVVLEFREFDGPFGVLRSSLTLTVGGWAIRRLESVPASHRRAWQANLLLPVHDLESAVTMRPIVDTLARPWGSVMLIGIGDLDASELAAFGNELQSNGVRCRTTVVQSLGATEALRGSLDVLRASFVRPNLLFLPLVREEEPGPSGGSAALSASTPDRDLADVISRAQDLGFGLCIYAYSESSGARHRYQRVDVWFTDLDVFGDVYGDESAIGLILLTAWKLSRAWQVGVRLHACADAAEREEVERTLERVVESARIPVADFEVRPPDLIAEIAKTPPDTLLLVGGVDVPGAGEIRDVVGATTQDCMFVCRSGSTAEG